MVRRRRRMRAKALRLTADKRGESTSTVSTSPNVLDSVAKYDRMLSDGLNPTTSSTDSSEVGGLDYFSFPVPCRQRPVSESENEYLSAKDSTSPPRRSELTTPPPQSKNQELLPIFSPCYRPTSPCYAPTTPRGSYGSDCEDVKPPRGLEHILGADTAGQLLLDNPQELTGLSESKKVNKLLDAPDSLQINFVYHSDTSVPEKTLPSSEQESDKENRLPEIQLEPFQDNLKPESGNYSTYQVGNVSLVGSTPDYIQAFSFPHPVKGNIFQLDPNTLQLQIYKK